jgi:hypothetical protein
VSVAGFSALFVATGALITTLGVVAAFLLQRLG